jgi:hypothetical protein
MKMLTHLQTLFKPSEKTARERMSALELNLDVIAKTQVHRYSRGNAAVQLGFLETEEELDASRKITIARRNSPL